MSAVTRKDALQAAAKRARAPRPSTPGHLHATLVRSTMVGLAWNRAKDHGHKVSYRVYREGRRLAKVAHTQYMDPHVRPATTYHYTVRAVDAHGRAGRRSHALTVKTPAATVALPASPGPAPVPAGVPGAGGGSVGPQTLTRPMVDRLFWRAGFGPSEADRQRWSGQPVDALIDFFLTTPNSLAPTGSPPTYNGNPIDPLVTDAELQMEWLDRMQRSTNPFVERLTFFWHRHWAVSRDAGVQPAWLLAYRDRLHRYSDLASYPQASFRDLAREMTMQDAAMSYYLTGYLNTKNSPNENYGREFMELFTLGITDAQGQPNYSQTDVHQLARAFTGYALDQTSGTVTFVPANADRGSKTILGQSGTFDATQAIEVVLGQSAHAPFLIRKLWNEFILAPIPDATLADLVTTYTAGNQLLLAPLLRKILTHALIFDSLDEPDMIKPPVLYTVGVLRTLAVPLRDRWQTDAMAGMQQEVYHPPNVAGWEGGLSWMTTTTAGARFDLIVRCQGLLPAVADVPAETPQQAYDRAYAAAGSPWLSAASAAQLLAFAQQAPSTTAAKRRERQYALVAFMLGGPDGQVS